MNGQKSSPKSTPAGLFVTVDQLNYTNQPGQTPAHRPHLFTYHLTIHNHSALPVTILARKWILAYEDGEMDVIEGDKVIGKTPELEPGKAFSYASFHLLGGTATAKGAFHGIDGEGNPVCVHVPEFTMTIPGDEVCN